MLKDRLRTSAILIAITSLLLYLDAGAGEAGQGVWLLPLLSFFAIGTARDLSHLLRDGGKATAAPWLLMAMTGVVALSACIPMIWPLVGSTYPANCPVGRLGWVIMGAVAAIFLILITEMSRYDGVDSQTIERTSMGVFVSLYVGLPMALFMGLRLISSGNWGLAAILTTVAVTKSTDAGAYFTGKAIGKHKLVPRLSPGKTWEGAIGGVVTATIVAFACLHWLFPALAGSDPPPASQPSLAVLGSPLGGALLLGPLLAITGMIGDLAESLVKRGCGAKDSGNWLPGLGGVWDVTDSLIATIMPAYLCFAAGVGNNI